MWTALAALYVGTGFAALPMVHREPTWFPILLASWLLTVPLVVGALKGRLDLLEPIYLISAAYWLYFVLAPALDLLDGSSRFFSMRLGDNLDRSLYVACFGFVSLLGGYYTVGVPHRSMAPTGSGTSVAIGKRYPLVLALVTLAGLVAYSRVSGTGLMHLVTLGRAGEVVEWSQTGGSLANYLSASLDWLVATVVLFAAVFGWRRLPVRLLWIVALVVYATVGFRYRLIVLGLAPPIWHHLRHGSRPSARSILLLLAFSFVAIGVVGSIRNQVRTGQNIEGVSTDRALFSFRRSLSIYQPFVAVIDTYPTDQPHYAGRSMAYALIQPIPRALWQAKPPPPVREIILETLGPAAVTSGVAYPNMGELWVDFGFVGVFGGMFLFGVGSAAAFRMAVRPLASEWTRMAYAIFLPFLVQYVSRGYLAQIVQQGVFFLLPIFVGMALDQTAGRGRRSAGVGGRLSRSRVAGEVSPR